MLTQQRLRELLDYDPVTGIFRWRHQLKDIFTSARGPRNRWAGTKAGATTVQGYHTISVDNERFRVSRLAWLYMTGEWPTKHIDHINGDQADDRWLNLREATVSQNIANAKLLRLNNTSGVRGVYWNKRLQKWHVRVSKIHYGYFDSLEEATKVRDAKAKLIYGAFAKLNNPSEELPKC
jgi:hypothetical protein